MPPCVACGADDFDALGACRRCGGGVRREIELDIPPAVVSQRAAAPRAARQEPEKTTFELAVELRPPASERATVCSLPAGSAGDTAAVGDLAFDARLLADYGEPPAHWLRSAGYTWRVLRRRRAVRVALKGRRDEAVRTATEAADAVVAFGERVRPLAEPSASYAAALDGLRAAEEVMRSRDRLLEAEQGAHRERLAQVDARLAALETQLEQGLREEQDLEVELGGAHGALAREETKLERVEGELHAAQQRKGEGGTGGRGLVEPFASMTTTASGARRSTLPASAGENSAGGTALAAWMQERSACVSSVARLRLSIAALQGRHAAARKRTLEMRPRVESARSERTSLEHWFARQVGTRAASVEEARHLVRLELLSIGRRAIADRATFGADFDADRARVAKLESAAESAARDVTVHEAALDTHDPRAFRAGLAWLGIAAALLIALVVWRATRVVAPPPATVPAQSPSH